MKIARCLTAVAALFVTASVQQRDFLSFPLHPSIVKGRAVLVTATLSPVAVHAGIEVLRRGGTAADAAATVALSEIATNLGSVVSYAGISQLLYFDAKTDKVYALDAGWGTYEHETDPKSIPPTDISVITGQPAPTGAGVGALGRQTLVPGFMAGIGAMHARFGRLPFASLFQPAIWYAQNGVTISPAQATSLQQRQPQLWRTSAGRRFASMPDGSLPKAGDVLLQPDLARTLEAVAAKGAAYMYTGEWARSFVTSVRAEGGQVTLEDLARYKPVWRDPLSVPFGGATVFGPGEDSSGTCPTLEVINLLSSLHIETLGSYWRDPKAFKAYVHALRFALYGHYWPRVAAFERAHGLVGDCRVRLTPQYAAAVSPHLASLLDAPEVGAEVGHDTQAIVVVDHWGNVAALLHSINTVNWGDTGIVVGGIPIADAGAINRDKLVKMKPGESVPNLLSPVIALKAGKPVLAVASTGVSSTPETIRLVGGVLAGGADLLSLMSAPPLLVNLNSFEPNQSLVNRAESIPTGAYDAQQLQAIEAEGVPVREESLLRIWATRGTAVMVVIDQPSGAPRAVEVQNVSGFAESDLMSP